MVSIYLITFNIKQHHYGDEKYFSNIIIENQIFALESVLITMLRVNKQKDIMPHPKLLCYITLLPTKNGDGRPLLLSISMISHGNRFE